MSFVTIGFIINIIICFGIPIGYLLYLIAARKGRVKAYFCGALVFLVSQIFLRIPIIQSVLPRMNWYVTMSIFYPVSYALFLSLTAGLFEEVGRFIGFKFALKKNRSWGEGIAFGIGHGGIEAMLITGLANIQNLIIITALESGSFDGSRLGISEESARALLGAVTGTQVLLAGLERICAIGLHVGLTILVLYGINKGKKAYLALAILIHGAVNFVAVTLGQMGISAYLIILWCAISALALLTYSMKIKKSFKGEVF
jgi:uncharacterized membrane protein YhfC